MFDQERPTEEFFDDFLSFLPIAICFVDSEGYILKINEKMEKISGYKKHELIDNKISKLLGSEASEVLIKEVKDEEMKVNGKEDDFPVTVFTEKRIEESGVKIFIAFSDLTRAKKIEREMEEKVKELERFNRLATGRELRMVELKRDKKRLKKKIERLEKEKEELEKENKEDKKENGGG